MLRNITDPKGFTRGVFRSGDNSAVATSATKLRICEQIAADPFLACRLLMHRPKSRLVSRGYLLEVSTMLRFRTKLLLLAMTVFGLGIGILSPLADGAYSAICLFALPILVALGGASAVADISNPPALKTKPERVPNRGMATLRQQRIR